MDIKSQNKNNKSTRLSIEYLMSCGFKPFKEEENIISYSLFKDSVYIGFEHYNWNVESTECYADWWILLIKSENLLIKYRCDTKERFEEILKFFEIKIK